MFPDGQLAGRRFISSILLPRVKKGQNYLLNGVPSAAGFKMHPIRPAPRLMCVTLIPPAFSFWKQIRVSKYKCRQGGIRFYFLEKNLCFSGGGAILW